MPQFSYRALDSSGKLVSGVLEATTENDLIQRLSAQGLRIQALSRGSLAAATPQIQQSTPHLASQPVARSTPVQAPVNPRNSGLTTASGVAVRTKRASRMDLHFTFANVANLSRAGFGAAQIFAELSHRAKKAHLKAAFQQLASTSTEGVALADAMQRLPDIFPEGAVGAVRAGETGGYLPESCERLALQFREDHRVAWRVRIMRWIIVSGFLGLPIGMALTSALDKVFDHYANMDSLPSVAERLKILSDAFWRSMVGPPGVIIVVFVAAYWTVAQWMKRTESRSTRHAWTWKVPLLKRYATNECLSALGWHLSKLSSAGIAPARAWQLAALAVPNIDFGQRAAAAGLNTTESTKMSELARRSGLFPPDHESLLFTGELSGSLPQSLEQSSGLANEELQHNRVFLNYALAGVGLALMAVFTIITLTTFYAGYFDSLMKQQDKLEQSL